jgi:hypothetical protein
MTPLTSYICVTSLFFCSLCMSCCPQELRSTLEDGNAVIDIVRTLRGAKCAEAVFEPPKLKPATLKGEWQAQVYSAVIQCAVRLPAD